MNIIKHEITLKSHFLQGWQILVHSLLLIVIPAYSVFTSGIERIDFAIKFAVIAFLLIFIPHLLLHIRYSYLSKGSKIDFDFKSNLISYRKGDVEKKFKLDQIGNVETTISKAKWRHQLRWYPWDSYCYSYIYLKTGEKLLVTSLLVPELFWPLKLPRENIRSAYFCWL